MEGIFIKLLNLSIQASILITVVLLLRFILNKSPKSIKCLLWALVAIRLVCPFSIESKFSLAPDAEVVSMDNYVGMPNVLSKTTGSDRYVKGYAESYDHEVVTVEKKNTDPLHIFSIIWLGGVVILAVYALGSCLKIWRRVKLSIRTTENIYICDRIDSPFIFGIIKPRIYLPSRMNEEQKESVIAHERAHLKRLDHFWKPFGFGLLSVYWFNPLCWLAYILFCRDIELACDEKVIKDMDAKQKKIYSKVLLSFSESEKHVLACPLAFGEVGVKERIKSILNYKKPTFWIIAVAVISILVTSVLFLTNPQNNTYEITFHIPAECEGALVFADEEISPKGKTVSFLVGQDMELKTIMEFTQSNETPSRAYVETLQERISADMVAGKLPFVVTSAIRENPLRLEVELTEMTDENINIIRSYETNGSAITIVQSSGIVDDLQHNNTDSQSRMAPGISKEDENLGVVYEEVDGGYVVDGDMFFEYYIVLTGKDPNAAHGTQFIVLTNDQHITYEQVSKSFLSSNSADSLSGTIVIGMKTID